MNHTKITGTLCSLVLLASSVRLAADGNVKSDAAAMDVAKYARVVTSDPARMTGTKAMREEVPAKDVFLTTGLKSAGDGSYSVPTSSGSVGCIGLEWYEFRTFRDVSLRFADPASVPEGVKLQFWVGPSSWQGTWKTLDSAVEKTGGEWTWKIVGGKGKAATTDKMRWLFPASAKPIVVNGFSAHTTTPWQTASVRIEVKGGPATFEVYNGDILDSSDGKSAGIFTIEPSKPLTLKLRYAKTGDCKTDQTVLRFTCGERQFSVGVENVLANQAIYVPAAGVFVTPAPAPISFDDYLKKIAGKKTIRKMVESMPDQTFQKAMAAVHDPSLNAGSVLLSLVGDERKFVAYRTGQIGFTLKDEPSAVYDEKKSRIFTGFPERHFPYRVQAVFGSGLNQKLSRRLDDEWIPIPVTSVNEKGIVYSVRSFLAPVDDASPTGTPKWLRRRAMCVAEYTIENTRSTAAEAIMTMSVLKDAENPKTQSPLTLEAVGNGVTASVNGRLLALIDTGNAKPLEVKNDSTSTIIVGRLGAKAKSRVIVLLPAWKATKEEVAEFRGKEAKLLDKMRSYWREILAPAAQIELPDVLLTRLIRASQVHIMLAAGNEDNGKRITPWTAAHVYGPLDSESQSIIRGMDMMGQQDFARRGSEFFMARYRPEGYMTTGYTLMGSGWHLWTVAECVDRQQNLDWLKEHASEFAGLCDWMVRQREKTKKLDANGEKVPNYGLMPPGKFADWERMTHTAFQEAQYCAGLREGARMLAKIGHPDAARFAKNAEEYRDAILRSYRWTQARSCVSPLSDGTSVPAQPPLLLVFGDVGSFFPGEDGNRAWCKNADSHQFMVNKVIDPNGEDATSVLDIMEDTEFLRPGLYEPRYSAEANKRLWFDLGGFNKCQPYYRRNVELYGLRDEVKSFIRGYFNTIPSSLNLENLSFWEHFHAGGAWNKTHETGWFLCQTRIMLVQERDDQLWLAPFVTRNWLKQGMKINVQNIPTNFGAIGYRIDSDINNGAITAVIDPPTAVPPSKMVLRLRVPGGKTIKAVTVNGQPHDDFDAKAETLQFKPSGERLNVRVEYVDGREATAN